LLVDFQTIVVGGGIVGLAAADACAAGGDTLIIERHGRLGQETTARSSEVVHAGLYYPEASLKARLCVEGRHLLQAFCAVAGVPYLTLGKLVVACTPDEVPRLEALAAQARANGVTDVRLVTTAHAQDMEPELTCCAALFSPSTAVVDSTGLMLALEARFIDRGGTVATATTVVAIERLNPGFRVITVSHGCETAVTCRRLVLAGGLSASTVAQLMTPPLPRVPVTTFAKGHYYALTGPRPFSRLIYPMPTTAGLGIHYTLSTAGDAKFGPDVQWCENPSPEFDDPDGSRHRAFVDAIHRYWPAVDGERLVPAYAGVRPKLVTSGAQDFAIEGPTHHGCDGLIALYGIESPGLTSSLAIGRMIADQFHTVAAWARNV
jgi:L-2-hydroxyglutarate oxidase LhgO